MVVIGNHMGRDSKLVLGFKRCGGGLRCVRKCSRRKEAMIAVVRV